MNSFVHASPIRVLFDNEFAKQGQAGCLLQMGEEQPYNLPLIITPQVDFTRLIYHPSPPLLQKGKLLWP